MLITDQYEFCALNWRTILQLYTTNWTDIFVAFCNCAQCKFSGAKLDTARQARAV